MVQANALCNRSGSLKTWDTSRANAAPSSAWECNVAARRRVCAVLARMHRSPLLSTAVATSVP
jgi:hypothetical protein